MNGSGDQVHGRQTALVTGASSGIGLELARLFAHDGYRLVLVAKNRARLEEVAGEFAHAFGAEVMVLAQDLAQSDSPDKIYAEMQARSIAVEVLVNNAGFGTYGFLAETDLKAELQQLQVNIVALTHLTKLFVRGMLDRGHGRILNVASTAAFQPGPLMAVYYASKAYVASFSEAIANELQGTGVTVTCLCPGPTRTEFHTRAGMERSRLVMGKMMDAAAVARIGYRGLMAGKTLVIPGLRNQLLALGAKLGPRGLVTKAAREFQESVP